MYLPKSKYTVSTAKMGEFMLNGKDYVGPVFTTYKGEVYAGSEPSLNKGQLVSIADSGLIEKTKVVVKRIPTEEEYQQGHMIRYFAQDIRTGKIVEILPETYKSREKDRNTLCRSTVWYLTGILEDELWPGTSRGVKREGCRTQNTKAMSLMEGWMPGIISSGVLCDPTQFFRK